MGACFKTNTKNKETSLIWESKTGFEVLENNKEEMKTMKKILEKIGFGIGLLAMGVTICLGAGDAVEAAAGSFTNTRGDVVGYINTLNDRADIQVRLTDENETSFTYPWKRIHTKEGM